MKKLFGALVKLFSLLAVLGALLYAAVLYWDKIMAVVAKLRGMLPGLSTAAVDDSEAEELPGLALALALRSYADRLACQRILELLRERRPQPEKNRK